MALPMIPDWLKLRDGSLNLGLGAQTVVVILNGQPQYRLDARPAGGQFMCAITQTTNGKRFDANAKFATLDAALVGGLDQLRESLGW